MVRSSFGPFAIVRHVGRRSGKQYETPIVVRPTENGFVIELTYGKEVDWYKNVQANNGCTIVWHGKEFVVNGVRPLDTQTGLHAFPLPVRTFLQVMRRTHFAKLVFDPEKEPDYSPSR
jgi:deazaflavin-dependent oxidoreductase (nitroreductase family)